MNRYCKNNRANKIVGLRDMDGIIIDQPWELGYICPICKRKGESLAWSEYNYFLYCRNCDIDIPSCFCIPLDHSENKSTKKYSYDGLKNAIKLFLDIIEDIQNLEKKE